MRVSGRGSRCTNFFCPSAYTSTALMRSAMWSKRLTGVDLEQHRNASVDGAAKVP